MTSRLVFASGLFSLLVTLGAHAFLPPTDTKNGLALTIEGFPDDSNDDRVSVRKVPATEPLEFTVTLKNESPHPVSGTLDIQLNDDWNIQGNSSVPFRADSGASVSHRAKALPAARVLDALYPIHARFTTGKGSAQVDLHPVAIFETTGSKRASGAKDAREAVLAEGILRLDRAADRRVFVQQKGRTRDLGVDFAGSDPESRATVHLQDIERGGVRRSAIGVHPPYQGGPGVTWSDYRLALPAGKPAILTFATSLRDHSATEPPSDGTEFKVIVITGDGTAKTLFERFSKARTWEEARVDLTSYAGQSITVRLWTGPGPRNDTTCDHCFWGDPVIAVGTLPPLPATEDWTSLETRTAGAAKQATSAPQDHKPNVFPLDVRGEKFGAAVVLGKQGLTDAVIAISDGTRTLTYRGFRCEVDRSAIGAVRGGQPVLKVETSIDNGSWCVLHHFSLPDADGRARPMVARARLRQDGGGLRVSWDMPGATRQPDGSPRFTSLGIGPANEPIRRAYAGFGNVMENPGAFDLTGGGFGLSTRHIGADYPNGLSLLQACDVFPDRLTWQPATRLFALETQHDASFLFIPSTKGAFAAARAYRDLNGFKEGPGVERLLGLMCLDQWGGDYREAAHALAEAGRYGLRQSVFVKHVWQRWGYDYRLPEIHPPAGGLAPFLEMRQAAANAGMLFCPHDNYIDFYPDAERYSYDQIVFTAGGQPVRAWYNQGRGAQSYRWLPHAFRPWMEPNMRQMRDTFRPDSLFIDVFTAIPPFDYHDRSGTFHSRTRTAREWRAAFDTCREILGKGSPMISEAGTDALVGSVDAGQADHFAAKRWLQTFERAERTPWHDMATHGKMILFAGGLGPRYSADDWNDHADKPNHGYGSDDYLSNTVIGGRNPMCDGPFSRRTVMTYWLLQPICDRLGRQSFEDHRFGASIHQQHSTFGDGGKVWTNRAPETWQVEGRILPEYGFLALTKDASAAVCQIDGQRAAFSSSPGVFFADARPVHHPLRKMQAESSLKEIKYLGNGSFEAVFSWNILDPLAPGYSPFIHLCEDRTDTGGEHIAFQAGMEFDRALLTKAGTFEARARITVPADKPAGVYQLRYGLYRPDTGARLAIRGRCDAGSRVRAGAIVVEKSGPTVTAGSHRPEPDDTKALASGLNTTGKMLDFGPLITNGAFRLLHDDKETWQLIPLPGSKEFRADLRLAKLGAQDATVAAVEIIDPNHSAAKPPVWNQQSGILTFTCDAQAFGYRIRFR